MDSGFKKMWPLRLTVAVTLIAFITTTKSQEASGFVAAASCGPPPMIENAMHNGTRETYPHRTVIKYTCNRGYTGQGFRWAACNYGEWLDRKPSLSCRVKVCPPPVGITNGRREGYVYAIGESVRYTCDPGYENQGSSVLVCLVSINWSGRTPSCVPLRCPRLVAPAHGRLTTDDVIYQTKVQVICDEGYIRTGAESRVCEADKTWTGEPNTCEEIRCTLPEIKFGTVAVKEPIKYGSIAVFRCEEGTTLFGEAAVVCIEQDKWSQTLPTCSDLCPVPTIQHGYVQKRRDGFLGWAKYTAVQEKLVNSGTKLYIKCNWNYQLTSGDNNEIFCDGGTWKNTPECKPAAQSAARCRQWPSDLENGERQIDGQEYGDSVTYSCNPGYNLEGPRQRRCNNGRWTEYKPRCVPKFCRQISTQLVNGRAEMTGQEHGNRVHYSCNSGYNLQGDSYRTCQFGDWSGNEPKCVPSEHGDRTSVSAVQSAARCGQWPSDLENGLRQIDGQEHGDSVSYSCNPGYNLEGPRQRMCNNGRWTEYKPRCVPNYCSLPSSLPEGVEVKDDQTFAPQKYSHNAVVAVQCKQGYRHQASADDGVVDEGHKWTCNDTEWTFHGKLKCVPEFCQYNASQFEIILPRGSENITVLPEGSQLRITCKNMTHFELKKSRSTAVCRYGKWYPRRPQCVAIPCPLYDDISHGEVIYPDHDTVLISRAVQHDVKGTVKCKKGYSIQGPKQVHCVYGNWRPAERPSCTPAPCPGFNSSGFPQDIPAAHGDILQVACSSGYHIIPSSVDKVYLRSIKAGCFFGQWQRRSPGCLPDTCHLPPYRNVAVSCGVNGSCADDRVIDNDITVTLACKDWYKWKDEAVEESEVVVTCHLGEWDRSVPSDCVPDGTPCEDPGDMANAIRTDGQYNSLHYPGDMVTYECHVGYVIDLFSRTQEIFCDVNGTWSKTPSNCTELLCEKPKAGARRFYAPVKKSYKYNDTLTFYCEAEYKLHGPETLTCKEDGEWDQSEPSCDDSKCPRLSWPANGRLISDGRSYLETVRFKCYSGFTLHGSESRTCLSTGQWSGSTTECVVARKACTVNEPAQGVLSEYRDTNNSTLTVNIGDRVPDRTSLISRCEDFSNGKFMGDNRRKCENGRWTGTEARCESIQLQQGITCPLLHTPENGVMTGDGRYIGANVQFRCKHGFLLEGTATRTCSSSGQWSGTAASCVGITCPLLHTPENGIMTGGGRYIGANIQFRCKYGFLLEGTATRTCSSSGQWSGTAASCVEITCPLLQTPENGIMTGGGRYIGANIQFRCKHGFLLEGTATRTCSSSGQWSGTAASCVDKSVEVETCVVNVPGSQVLSVYLDHNGSKFSVRPASMVRQGTVMLSRCRSFVSQRFTGDSRRVCQHGQWSGKEASCSEVKLTEGIGSHRYYGPQTDVKVTDQGSLSVKQGDRLRLSCRSQSYYVTFSSPRGLDDNMKLEGPKQGYGTPYFYYDISLYTYNIGVHHSGTYFCINSHTKVPSAEFNVSVY